MRTIPLAVLVVALVAAVTYAYAQQRGAARVQQEAATLHALAAECSVELGRATRLLDRQSVAIEEMADELLAWRLRADSAAAEVEAIRERSLADARTVLAAEVPAEADSAFAWMVSQSYELMRRWERW